MGRPTKYKKEYEGRLIKFFDVESFEDVVLPHYFNDTKHRIKWKDFKRVACKLPTLRDFAKSIRVPISTIYDWLNEKHGSFHKGFSDAFTHAKELRKDFLIQNALQGLYPPLTFKFVAVNLTDMRDTSETEVTGDLNITINEKFKGGKVDVRIEPEYTEKQTIAIRALRKPGPVEVLYGGSEGGGKSHLGCVWMYIEALKDIKRFDIQPRKNPLCLGFMGRMVGKDFKDTTLETWKREIPENGYQIKGNPPEIIIAGRVKYLTGGLDPRETINKFNSAEYARAFIDQAEETEKEKIRLLRAATHNRLIINGTKIPGKILWTANPRQCWLKTEFIDIIKKVKEKIKRLFVRALPSDNPHLGDDYVDVLRDIFADRPELLRAYLLGDWEILAGVEQIIKNIWITEAAQKMIHGAKKRPRLVCDTARFGDDECVIDYMETTDVEEQIIMPYCRSTEISQRLSEESYKHKDCPIVVEATGSDLGAAVADELIVQGKQVIIFNPQGKSSQPKKFYNQRAEAWAITARKFSKGQIQLKNAVEAVDIDVLTEQLCAPTYKFRKSRTIVEEKADIKARLGRSPDRADCFVIGQWSYDKVPVTEENIDEWGRGQKKDEDKELADSYAVKSNF